MPGTEQTAMGGPEEPVEGAASCRRRRTAIRLPEPRRRSLHPAGENETLAMGGPEEPVDCAAATGDELAAYEPLPEDAVMPASDWLSDKDSPDVLAL